MLCFRCTEKWVSSTRHPFFFRLVSHKGCYRRQSSLCYIRQILKGEKMSKTDEEEEGALLRLSSGKPPADSGERMRRPGGPQEAGLPSKLRLRALHFNMRRCSRLPVLKRRSSTPKTGQSQLSCFSSPSKPRRRQALIFNYRSFSFPFSPRGENPHYSQNGKELSRVAGVVGVGYGGDGGASSVLMF